jgi:hypothetical protein
MHGECCVRWCDLATQGNEGLLLSADTRSQGLGHAPFGDRTHRHAAQGPECSSTALREIHTLSELCRVIANGSSMIEVCQMIEVEQIWVRGARRTFEHGGFLKLFDIEG